MRFADLISDLENNAALHVGEYPDTLTAAHNIAARYNIPRHRKKDVRGAGITIFATEAYEKKSEATFKCRLCGGVGHVVAKCQWLEEAREALQKSKDTKEEMAAVTCAHFEDEDYGAVIF